MRIDPGPWEVDENGKRFRRVGPGCIEYPMTITTTYGEFEVDKVPPPPEDKEPPRPKRYTDKGCGIVTGEGPTPGRRCPFGNKVNPTTCKDACAFWELCNNRKENN